MNKTIYLDNAATTPVRSEVLDAMQPYLSEKYGNPSSIHSLGQEAREAIEKARAVVANALNCESSEVYFTGSITEADNLVLAGIIRAIRVGVGRITPHVIISPLEHHAVLDCVKALEKDGLAEITILPVDKYGLVDDTDVKKSIRPNTVLVSIMYASNEVGTIQPVGEISQVIPHDIYFHTDAAAAAEYLDLDVKKLGIDTMVIGPHKFRGPKGVGILYIKKGVKISPSVHGGMQEEGLRPGTHNVPAIVGGAKALELASKECVKESKRVRGLSQRLIDGLLGSIAGSFITGHPKLRVPHIASFIFGGAEGEAMVLALSDEGIMASTGSACSSESLEPSHVLLAMGVKPEEAHGSVRFSLGRETTEGDIDHVLKIMPEVVRELRKMNPLYNPRS
jgi:cysteine desulfurase